MSLQPYVFRALIFLLDQIVKLLNLKGLHHHGCKDTGVRNFEYETKTQFFLQKTGQIFWPNEKIIWTR